jgi:nuclear transport factor 2 (NTF2) superfamily protein
VQEGAQYECTTDTHRSPRSAVYARDGDIESAHHRKQLEFPQSRASRGSYTPDSYWRNRSEFLHGREEIIAFLTRKWATELEYRLIKELWAFGDNRIAVRFAYESRDDSGQ